jgi:hypothetical protein
VVFLCCAFVAPSVLADPSIDKSHQIKAAYLYNILKFVDWPEANTKLPLVLCVYGENPFGDLLKALESRTVAGRPIKINYITATPGDTCDVVFVNIESEAQIKKALAVFNIKGVLTVGDIPNFTKLGGIIQFVEKDNTIRFNLNLTQAKAMGLSISSQLAETALEVQ